MDDAVNPDDTLPDDFYAADTLAELDALPDLTTPDFPVPRPLNERLRRKPKGSEEE